MNVLSDVLNLVRFKSCLYFRSGFASPWGMRMGHSAVAQFHIVVRGHCYLKLNYSTDKPRLLSSGDIVMFPGGDAHSLVSGLDSPVVPGVEVLRGCQTGEPLFQDGEISAVLVCGHFELDRGYGDRLLSSLPQYIHLQSADSPDVKAAQAIAELIGRELDQNMPGSAVVANRLAEGLFVLILRAYVAREKPKKGFLAALHDPKIGRSLELIHQDHSGELNLETLAQSLGMSRSSFAQHFRDTLGLSPMAYAAEWRLIKARNLIETSTQSLGEISEIVGYESEPAFHRAFKRKFNENPGEVRRRAKRL